MLTRGGRLTGPEGRSDMKTRVIASVIALLFACNDASKPGSLTTLTDVTTSTKCPAGGVRIATGLDANFNKMLEPSEVSQTSEVCNGKTPADGMNGMNGMNGAAGDAGVSGLNAL